ncbi:CDP-alcohol phosphatidyltransferase family protein [Nocardioides rubriscoriae]|uniref:CDP-alcohol phosphatidyltransferase family protein n=1 Tax=Nocardioides rubriscoriae TaxID=642762 RepID=UPI001B86D8D6|nr:CDP-alcohol phosphatidyltransferase family protein [Nocardioides rubriscoriae]
MDRRAEALAHWSRLHGGIDPSGSVWISAWVRLSHACARPLARRGVRPGAVTTASAAVVAPVPVLAGLGHAWPLAALLLVAVSAVLDGVDGAVAAQTGTDTAWGRVLDPLADRAVDVVLVVTLVVLGAPLWLGAALAVLTLLLESVRATAQAAGLAGAGAITVWERPSRVIVTVLALAATASVGLVPAVDAAVPAKVAVAVGLALAVVGLVHLTVAVRRQLLAPRAQAGPTSPATMRADSTTSGSPPPGCDEPPTR